MINIYDWSITAALSSLELKCSGYLFYHVTICAQKKLSDWSRMVHCNSELSMCVCNFYRIVIKSVLNGIGLHYIKKLLESVVSHMTYFVKLSVNYMSKSTI